MDEIAALIGPRFARSEPRKNAVAYMQGLLSERERKNSWTLSEQVGQAVPDPMQRLLSTTDWDPDAVRDDLRSYVVDHLGDRDGVLIVDETGFVKKGDRSAGVARQYTGTAGRIENAQVGVFLTYATSEGRTFLDRELYLPKSWTGDLQRCRGAGIPSERGFRTKPELAMQMIAGAIDGGVPASWVTGDAVYGGHYRLRKCLEDRQVNYVLAVASNQHVIAKTSASVIGIEYRADALIAALPAAAWRTRSAGQGTKGDRRYARARARINGHRDPDAEYWLLAHRSLADPADLAYYLCHAPKRVSLAELARVAGTRWAIEETFQTAKGHTGLDHYQVRQYTGWYRHITLSMLAHAFLTVTRSKRGLESETTPNSSG
ncbi:IS701 family transposase [Brevibacterium sp. 'Marine']|uniref:IS701 family transposase n=1 Tax=Brevibacterium sp. 'Marine' TaxID=2725563 RepID=UPI00145D99B0|nr:IS701 family transposase [Brevibacterium sp. 'Marine']